MTDQSDPLAVAHEVLAQMRTRTPELDGTDDSVWFVQGALSSMANDPRAQAGAGSADRFAYAVYVAELLASSCEGVRVEVEAEAGRVAEVTALSDRGPRQYVLSWVQQCIEDPNTDNIVFKYSGALRVFNQPARAARLDEQLREYMADGHRF